MRLTENLFKSIASSLVLLGVGVFFNNCAGEGTFDAELVALEDSKGAEVGRAEPIYDDSAGLVTDPAIGEVPISDPVAEVPIENPTGDLPIQSGDPGLGSGLWVPPNTSGRIVADQSGIGITTSYVPGCLNGSMPPTASATGCGGAASYEGIIYGTTKFYSFSFGSGKVLSLRYFSKATAGKSVKYFTMSSGDGGSVGQSVKVWLSSDPSATYEATAATCRSMSNSTIQPYVITGPGYCTIVPSKLYYLHVSIDVECSTCRYKVNEGNSDFIN